MQSEFKVTQNGSFLCMIVLLNLYILYCFSLFSITCFAFSFLSSFKIWNIENISCFLPPYLSIYIVLNLASFPLKIYSRDHSKLVHGNLLFFLWLREICFVNSPEFIQSVVNTGFVSSPLLLKRMHVIYVGTYLWWSIFRAGSKNFKPSQKTIENLRIIIAVYMTDTILSSDI